jgi:beta-lactamase regulating signal transducer with metallopeptidase domain
MTNLTATLSFGLIIAAVSLALLTIVGRALARLLSERGQMFFWLAVLGRGAFVGLIGTWTTTVPTLAPQIKRITLRFTDTLDGVGARLPWWKQLANMLPHWSMILVALWMTGVLAMLLATLIQSLRYARQAESGTEIVEGPLLASVRNLARSLGMRPWIRLFESRDIRGPAVFGLIRFRLLVPAGLLESLSEQERTMGPRKFQAGLPKSRASTHCLKSSYTLMQDCSHWP